MRLPLLACLALTWVACPAAATGERLPTIFIAGDSTAASYGTASAQQGWGAAFAAYVDPARATVDNRARGGRSSRTFITEGLWAALRAELRAGDVVLIQFGHNDGGAINEEPPGSTRPVRARGSLPGLGDETVAIDNVVTGQPEVVRSFGAYLREMIAEVRAAGATPVLLTPTARNLWTDGVIERGEQHRWWTRELARAEGVAVVDVTRLLADEWQVVGPAATAGLFAGDHVHPNPAGADFVAQTMVAGLKGLRDPAFPAWWSERGAAVRADALGWLNLPEPRDRERPTLWLIGDSTVRNGGGDGARGQWGWGEPLAGLLESAGIEVVNRAIGGLSSRTFVTQGHWARVRPHLRPGDMVIMQFGHNDAGPLNDTSRARGTLPGAGDELMPVRNLLTGELEIVGSYGSYLRRYVTEARERGAIPLVATPVPRQRWTEEGGIVRGEGSYPDWARQVASELDVACLDLAELVAARYEALGAEAVRAFFADAHTHTTWAGAELTAEIVADWLRGYGLVSGE